VSKKQPLCEEYSPEIKGGIYSCAKREGHHGRHFGESGDRADDGFYGDWIIGEEYVKTVREAMDIAEDRVHELEDAIKMALGVRCCGTLVGGCDGACPMIKLKRVMKNV